MQSFAKASIAWLLLSALPSHELAPKPRSRFRVRGNLFAKNCQLFLHPALLLQPLDLRCIRFEPVFIIPQALRDRVCMLARRLVPPFVPCQHVLRHASAAAALDWRDPE